MDQTNSALLVDPLEPVVVYSTERPELAAIAISYLEQEQIDFIRSEYSDDGPIKLLVARKHAANANAILSRWDYLRNHANELESGSYTKASLGLQLAQTVNLGFLVSLGLYSFGPVYRLIFIIVIPIAASMLFLGRAFLYRDYLNRLGYEWISLRDSNDIFWNCRRYAKSLPPAADVEVIPGFQRNPEYIVRFLNGLIEYKRNAASRRSK